MNLTPLAANMTEVKIGTTVVLFSYKTPVACFDYTDGTGIGKFFRTEKRWSNTTQRHINKWLGNNPSIFKPQEYFDTLLQEVK